MRKMSIQLLESDHDSCTVCSVHLSWIENMIFIFIYINSKKGNNFICMIVNYLVNGFDLYAWSNWSVLYLLIFVVTNTYFVSCSPRNPDPGSSSLENDDIGCPWWECTWCSLTNLTKFPSSPSISSESVEPIERRSSMGRTRLPVLFFSPHCRVPIPLVESLTVGRKSKL